MDWKVIYLIILRQTDRKLLEIESRDIKCNHNRCDDVSTHCVVFKKNGGVISWFGSRDMKHEV